MLGKTDAEYSEKLLDGNVLLHTRNGIFQVRLYKGNRQYIYKSLKTRDVDAAREAAVRAYYELEFRKKEQLPLQSKRFGEVLTEYLALRERQHLQGTYKHSNKLSQQQTSAHMLRQMQRVSRFWHEYCGKTAVDKVSNAVLRDYVAWRTDYYKRMAPEKRPRNHSINPADKTLEWETTFALTVLKYAHERGYLGVKAAPNWRYKAQRTPTRPAFSLAEYRRLYKGLRRWMWEERGNAKRRYTRELLRDYVLILANSGIRVGEANNLRESDIEAFVDERGRENYRLRVTGKTGKRWVIVRTNAKRYIDRVLERNAAWRDTWSAGVATAGAGRKRKSTDHNRLFRMADGSPVITLIDQFNTVLEREGITHNTDGEKYTLYSLRHFYAVQMLRHGKVQVFDIARNMGTSVQIIETYYGKHATATELATRLGG